MLDHRTIENIATGVAEKLLGGGELERVRARDTLDSEGEDALRVTVVLTPRGVAELTGEAATDLLWELKQALAKEGEERLAIVEYATEAEMQEEQEEEKERRRQEAETDGSEG